MRVLEVAPSAWWPPGVRVKDEVREEGIWGRVVIGLRGRKRMRWSSDCGGGAMVVNLGYDMYLLACSLIIARGSGDLVLLMNQGAGLIGDTRLVGCL